MIVEIFVAFAAICDTIPERTPADSVNIEIDTSGTPVDTSYVEYNDSPITFPLKLGLRVPSYTRVDGLVLPWGPRFATASSSKQRSDKQPPP